jgi:hypothetical protein
MHHIFALPCNVVFFIFRVAKTGLALVGLERRAFERNSPCFLFGREARYLGSSSSRRHPKVHRLDMLGTRVWLNMPPQVAPNYGELAEYGPGLGSEKKGSSAKNAESVGFGICIV